MKTYLFFLNNYNYLFYFKNCNTKFKLFFDHFRFDITDYYNPGVVPPYYEKCQPPDNIFTTLGYPFLIALAK